METPFDSLISGLWQLTINDRDRDWNSSQSEVIKSVFAFSKITRVLYINMVQASEKMQVFTEAASKETATRTLTQEELLEEWFDFPIRCRVSYMQFIEHINRSGRFLIKIGFTPPLYGRVRFFRNKVVEHVDLYMKLLTVGYHDGFILPRGKIAIPYAYAGISRPDGSNIRQELTDVFAELGITLPTLEGIEYGEYSEIIYASLEKIDGKLRRFDKKTGVGIPEPIVRLLFKSSFPTPICDMEEYCKILAEWLEVLPLQ